MRPSSRRRREAALPRDSLTCTCSLTRSPAISGGEVYRRRLDFRWRACVKIVDEKPLLLALALALVPVFSPAAAHSATFAQRVSALEAKLAQVTRLSDRPRLDGRARLGF